MTSKVEDNTSRTRRRQCELLGCVLWTRSRARRWIGCYKQRQKLRLAKMERAWKVEENAITRLKLTREGAKFLPPLPRSPRGKVSNSEGEEEVLSSGKRWSGGGVSRRCSRIGQLGRWSHGATWRRQGRDRAARARGTRFLPASQR